MPRGYEAGPRQWTCVHTGSVVVSVLTYQAGFFCRYVDTSGVVVEYYRIPTVLSRHCINLRYLEYSLI